MRPLEEVPSFSCSYALQRGRMPASQVSPGRPSTSSLHACTPATDLNQTSGGRQGPRHSGPTYPPLWGAPEAQRCAQILAACAAVRHTQD